VSLSILYDVGDAGINILHASGKISQFFKLVVAFVFLIDLLFRAMATYHGRTDRRH
jgi:hypothetical protein